MKPFILLISFAFLAHSEYVNPLTIYKSLWIRPDTIPYSIHKDSILMKIGPKKVGPYTYYDGSLYFTAGGCINSGLTYPGDNFTLYLNSHGYNNDTNTFRNVVVDNGRGYHAIALFEGSTKRTYSFGWLEAADSVKTKKLIASEGGLYLNDHKPNDTENTLYNVGGGLFWKGIPLGLFIGSGVTNHITKWWSAYGLGYSSLLSEDATTLRDSGSLNIKDTLRVSDQSKYGITAYNSKFDLVDAHHTSAALDNDNISGLIGYDFLSNSEDSSLFFGVKDIDENNFYGLAINTSHLYASFNIPLSVDSLNVSDKIIYQGSPLFDSGACPCSLYFASTLEVVSTVHYFIANNVATLMIYPMNAIGPGSVHIKVRVPSKLASTYVLDVPGIIADGGNTEIGLIEIAGREIELFTSGRDFLSAGTCGTGLANGMGSTVITYPLK